MVAFWQLFLSAFSHSATAPCSRIRLHFAAFAHSQHSMVAFWQVLRNLCIRLLRFGSFSSLRILPPHTCPPFSHTITFLQLLLTLSIQWSHYGRFCAISTFVSRVLAALPHRILTRCPCHLFSHMIAFLKLQLTLRIRWSNFGSFRSLLAFDGRILVDFDTSQHSMVAFWRLFSSAFSHAARAPHSRVQSHFCRFC